MLLFVPHAYLAELQTRIMQNILNFDPIAEILLHQYFLIRTIRLQNCRSF